MVRPNWAGSSWLPAQITAHKYFLSFERCTHFMYIFANMNYRVSHNPCLIYCCVIGVKIYLYMIIPVQ